MSTTHPGSCKVIQIHQYWFYVCNDALEWTRQNNYYIAISNGLSLSRLDHFTNSDLDILLLSLSQFNSSYVIIWFINFLHKSPCLHWSIDNDLLQQKQIPSKNCVLVINPCQHVNYWLVAFCRLSSPISLIVFDFFWLLEMSYYILLF